MRGGTSRRPERHAPPQETAVEHQLRRAILAAACGARPSTFLPAWPARNDDPILRLSSHWPWADT
jgi:hypothetical protein